MNWMNDPLSKLLAGMPLSTTAFPPNSRYHGIELTTHESADGETIVHLRRRFVPPASQFSLLQEHTVVAEDRLDNLAHFYVNDSLRYWQICDANNAIEPDELTSTPGRKLRITLPEGIPGTPNA